MSNAYVFHFCAATIQSGGGDLSKFPLFKESIHLTRVKADGETTKMIKDNFSLSQILRGVFRRQALGHKE